MRQLIEKVQNSEFLTLNELLKVKVSLVMVFLLIFGAFTIPVSFFEDFDLSIRIIVPSIFVFLFTITFIALMINKSRFAMHFSIYTFIGLTIYYVGASGQLYGYFLIFITLTVLIFYQDITTYILYGGPLTIYGIYYIQTNDDLITDVIETSPQIGPIIYQIILATFFIVFMINFILTQSIEEKLNEDFMRTHKSNRIYRSYLLRLMNDISDRNNETLEYKNDDFHRLIRKLVLFINDKLEEPLSDLDEVIEFYFFLHTQNTQKILQKTNIPNKTKNYTVQLEKYLIHKNSDLDAIIINSICEFKENYSCKNTRYDYHLDAMFQSRTNRILALALIYKFLSSEPTGYDKWGRLNEILTHGEVKKLFQTKFYREYLSFEDVNFFLKNESLYKKYL